MRNQDFQYIIVHPSGLSQEFDYAEKMLEPQSQTTSSPPFFTIDDVMKEIESQAIACVREDPFGEPYYKQPLEPKFSLKRRLEEKQTGETSQPIIGTIGINNVRQVILEPPRQTSSPVERLEQLSSQSNSQSSDGQPSKKKNAAQKKKRNQPKRDQYPTKNFLPCFRASFIRYIRNHYGNIQEFNSFEIIKRIRGKACINLRDYRDLFKQKEFRPILKEYFKNQVIIRDLMQSRIDYDVKLEYFGRIHVFEEAFESGVFNKIN